MNQISLILCISLVLMGAGCSHPSPIVEVESQPVPTTIPTKPEVIPPADLKIEVKSVPVAPQPVARTFTVAEVAKHGGDGDCYTIIEGSVYNLTSWVHQHPGGERAILSICGKDGTSAFENKHGGGSPREENMLATFKLGALVK